MAALEVAASSRAASDCASWDSCSRSALSWHRSQEEERKDEACERE